MLVIDRLKAGDFNRMVQKKQPDDLLLVILTKRNDPHIYKMLVKDLYGDNEEVLWEEVINAE